MSYIVEFKLFLQGCNYSAPELWPSERGHVFAELCSYVQTIDFALMLFGYDKA